ncbi:hypothetical protein D6853_09690 [Butyrivibrio sp. X503]|uniref:hypothetical protein n=1 Tax=Butyrivibrio sp. X503 TaxID=2364878 RepID=UPI000EAA9191|nr:hypothetical protein [Butyrivibrio sp. X503]RKM55808.1 hypothetical protein D6853_09690 [Butyrivibrio sp. X503]
MMKKKFKIILSAVIIVVVATIMLTSYMGYYLACIHAISKIECLDMPDDITVYGETKAEASDIYWVHMRAEKIIVCDGGPEYVQEYLEKNNSEFALRNIDVEYFTGMTDTCMYDFDMLPDYEIEKIIADDSDRYVRIVYEHKYFWLPISWYYYAPVSLV